MNTLKEGREHFNNNHSIVAELKHYILLLFLSISPARCHYFFKLAYILLKGKVFSRKTRIISKKVDFDNRSFFSSIKGILDNMYLHDVCNFNICFCLDFLLCVFSYVPSKLLLQRMHSHTLVGFSLVWVIKCDLKWVARDDT